MSTIIPEEENIHLEHDIITLTRTCVILPCLL